MSGTEIETATEQEQRDQAIAEAITAGRSVGSVRKQFHIGVDDLDRVLERLWPLDLKSRIRMIATDLAILNRLTEVLLAKALAGCTQSSLCVIRVLERKHELLGMNSAAKIEIVQAPPEQPSDFEKIRRAVFSVARGDPDYKPKTGNGPALPLPDATNGGSDPQ